MGSKRRLNSLHPFWDRGIRFLARNPAHLEALIRLFDPHLAERLVFRRMRLLEGSFIDERYRQSEVDLLVRLPYRAAGVRATSW